MRASSETMGHHLRFLGQAGSRLEPTLHKLVAVITAVRAQVERALSGT